MRNTLFALLLLLCATPIAAQELILSEPGSNSLCVGESLVFTLTATGNFGPNNTFVLQSSSDGFKSFDNITLITPAIASAIKLEKPGFNLSYRVVASEPFIQGKPTVSAVNVWPLPSHPRVVWFPYKAVANEPFSTVYLNEVSKFGYKWNIQDGVLDTTAQTLSILFSSGGTKRIEIINQNEGGCADTAVNDLIVYTCEARIPKTAHIVTGEESGTFDFVWIKAGGKFYSGSGINGDPVIFMETGSTLVTDLYPTVYAKPGASIYAEKHSGYVVLLQDGGVSVDPTDQAKIYDCPDMQFDYSEVASSVEEEQLKADLEISVDPGTARLSVRAEGRFTAKVIDATGRTMIDRTEMMDAGSLDLHDLSKGVYFVLITRGLTTIARQIQR